MDTHERTEAGIGFALFELAPRLTRLENAVLGEVDPPLTFRQYRHLQRVAEGVTTLTALGRMATISLPAVSESVEGLVRKGLLQRHADDQDRRSVQLRVTPEGHEALATAQQLLAEAAEELLDGLLDEHPVEFEQDLRELAERVAQALVASRNHEARGTA